MNLEYHLVLVMDIGPKEMLIPVSCVAAGSWRDVHTGHGGKSQGQGCGGVHI